jgi:hypothetical protein
MARLLTIAFDFASSASLTDNFSTDSRWHLSEHTMQLEYKASVALCYMS